MDNTETDYYGSHDVTPQESESWAAEPEPAECLEGPDGCAGPVEYRWPGYGTRSWPRCERHGDQRVQREEEARGRYPDLQPADFDPGYAGERWDEDY